MDRIKTPLFPITDDNELNEVFHCGTCKHSIPIRDSLCKIVCVQTLNLHESGDIALCEYAERKE